MEPAGGGQSGTKTENKKILRQVWVPNTGSRTGQMSGRFEVN